MIQESAYNISCVQLQKKQVMNVPSCALSVLYILLFLFVGLPTVLRMDRGTENVLMATTQIALRSLHNDKFAGEKGIRFGKSTTNTVRIMIQLHVC